MTVSLVSVDRTGHGFVLQQQQDQFFIIMVIGINQLVLIPWNHLVKKWAVGQFNVQKQKNLVYS